MSSERLDLYRTMKRFPSIVLAVWLTSSVMMPSLAAPSLPLTSWAHVNEIYLRYQLSGSGPDTIVLLHEGSMTLESWDYVAPALSKKHQVLRYDLRGYGLSQAIKGPINIDDQVADLVELLKSLNIKGKVHLVGGAVGGAVALKFAADHPDLVANVIAISPAAYLQGRALQSTTAPPAGAAPAPPPPISPSVQEGAYPSALRKVDPARYEHYKAIEASSGSASGGGQSNMAAVYAVKYAEVLPTIRVPTVIAATSLWIRTPAEFKELADVIPNSRFEVLETGHFAALASPELVIALINKYVK